MTNEQFYKIGDTVPKSGMYQCIQCGSIQQFLQDEQFTTCEACLAGTIDGPEGFQSPEVEFWQFIS